MESLNGMELGQSNLKVKRASIGATQAAGPGSMGVNAMSMLAGTTSKDLEQGRCLQLLNMTTVEELMDNDEYAGKRARLYSLEATACSHALNETR